MRPYMGMSSSSSYRIPKTPRRSAVVGEAPASHVFVAGMYAHGGFYGVTSSCREFESLVKYLTAFVRSRIGIPFAAVGILDGCSLEAHRDSHNLRGSLNIVIPLTQGGQNARLKP